MVILTWDVHNGRLLRTWQGHSGPVRSLAFSPDGKRLLSASEDATLRIWSVATGGTLATIVVGRDDEWPALADQGFFTASPGGMDLIHIVRGNDSTAIEQVHQALFNPDRVREEIASHFGVTEQVVKRRLALSRLIPEVKTLYREEAIDPGDLQILTLGSKDPRGIPAHWPSAGHRP